MKRLLAAVLLLISFDTQAQIINPPSGGPTTIPVPISQGGTGATTIGGVLETLFSAVSNGIQLVNRTAALTYQNQTLTAVLGVCNLTDYDPNFNNEGETTQGTTIQNALLNCQVQAINAGAQTFASNHIPACFEFNTTASPFGTNLQTPIEVPRYVCFNPHSSFVRDGSSGSFAGNWNGSTTTSALSGLEEPLFVIPPTGIVSGSIKATLNRVGTDRGSGIFYGRTWRMAALTLQASGTGLASSSAVSCSVRNGDTQAPSASATFILNTNSSGVGTSITFAPTRWQSIGGQYYVPPFLQRQQWAVSNGWNGSDSRHPQVFDNDTNKYYKTTCGGVDYGVTVSAKFWPDWCTGSAPDADTVSCTFSTAYDGIFSNFSPSTGYVHQIYAVQSANTNDANYGPTYGFWADAFDVDIDLIQTGQARYGAIFYGADLRVNTINDVGSWANLKMVGGGSFSISEFIGDTPIDHFAEIDTLGNFYLNGHLLNTGSSLTGSAAILLGSNSSGSNHNAGGIINLNMANAGATGGIPVFSCAYTRGLQANVNVENLSASGSALGFQNNAIVNGGTNCEASNVFRYSIDNQTGSMVTGVNNGFSVVGKDDNQTAMNFGNNTNAIILPIGTTGQEPTGVAGMIRYNSTVPRFEGYISGAWSALGGSSVSVTALTPGATVAWNVGTAPLATLAPVQSFTLSNPTGLAAGNSYELTITQDATGSRIITWGNAYIFPGGTKFVLSTAANAVDTITCYTPDGTNMQCNGLAAFQ